MDYLPIDLLFMATFLWSMIIIIVHDFYDYHRDEEGLVTPHPLETLVEALLFLAGESLLLIHYPAFVLNLFGQLLFFWAFKFIVFPEVLNHWRGKPFGYTGTTSGKFKAAWLDKLTGHISVMNMLLIKLLCLAITVILNIYIIPLIIKHI